MSSQPKGITIYEINPEDHEVHQMSQQPKQIPSATGSQIEEAIKNAIQDSSFTASELPAYTKPAPVETVTVTHPEQNEPYGFVPPAELDLTYTASQPEEYAIIQQTIDKCQRDRRKQKRRQRRVTRRSKRSKKNPMQQKCRMNEPPGTKDDTVDTFDHDKYNYPTIEITFRGKPIRQDEWRDDDGDNIYTGSDDENSESEISALNRVMRTSRGKDISEDTSTEEDTSESEISEEEIAADNDPANMTYNYDDSFIDDSPLEDYPGHETETVTEQRSTTEPTNTAMSEESTEDDEEEKDDKEEKESTTKQVKPPKKKEEKVRAKKKESAKPKRPAVTVTNTKQTIEYYFNRIREQNKNKQRPTRVVVNGTTAEAIASASIKAINPTRAYLTDTDFSAHDNLFKIGRNFPMSVNGKVYQSVFILFNTLSCYIVNASAKEQIIRQFKLNIGHDQVNAYCLDKKFTQNFSLEAYFNQLLLFAKNYSKTPMEFKIYRRNTDQRGIISGVMVYDNFRIKINGTNLRVTDRFKHLRIVGQQRMIEPEYVGPFVMDVIYTDENCYIVTDLYDKLYEGRNYLIYKGLPNLRTAGNPAVEISDPVVSTKSGKRTVIGEKMEIIIQDDLVMTQQFVLTGVPQLDKYKYYLRRLHQRVHKKKSGHKLIDVPRDCGDTLIGMKQFIFEVQIPVTPAQTGSTFTVINETGTREYEQLMTEILRNYVPRTDPSNTLPIIDFAEVNTQEIDESRKLQ